MGRHEAVNTRSEHYSPRVEGSIPVGGNFFLEFCFVLIQFWHRCQNDLFRETLRDDTRHMQTLAFFMMHGTREGELTWLAGLALCVVRGRVGLRM